VNDDLFNIELNETEVRMIGEHRWSKEHNLYGRWAIFITVLSLIYILVTIGAGQLYLVGLLVPLVALGFLGLRSGRRARDAGVNFLQSLKDDRKVKEF